MKTILYEHNNCMKLYENNNDRVRRRVGNERQACSEIFAFRIACKAKEKRLCASWSRCTKSKNYKYYKNSSRNGGVLNWSG